MNVENLMTMLQNIKKLFKEISLQTHNLIVIDEEDGDVKISVKSRKMQLFFRVDRSGTYISAASMQLIDGQLQIVPSSINLTAEQSARYNIYNDNL